MSAPTEGERPRGSTSVQLASKFQRLAARAIDSVIMVGMYWLLEALDAAPPAFYSWLVTGDTLEVTLSWGSIRDAVTLVSFSVINTRIFLKLLHISSRNSYIVSPEIDTLNRPVCLHAYRTA